MHDLTDLYQKLILDHGRHPRNHFSVDPCEASAGCFCQAGYNPMCGDQVTMYLTQKNGVFEAASFTGEGCAICMASASLLTEWLPGKTEEEWQAAFRLFTDCVKGVEQEQPQDLTPLGKLAVLEGVKQYPMRVKCATLAWHAAHGALSAENQGEISTEES